MGHSITEAKEDDNLNCLVSIMYPTNSDCGSFLYIVEATVLLLPKRGNT